MAAETLELRVVPAANAPLTVSFEGGTLTLTGSEDSDEAVIVKTGTAFTDVFLGGVFHSRVSPARQNTLTTIVFDGLGGADSLTFVGQNPAIAIELTGVETLQLTSRDTTVQSNGPLTLAGSKVTGTLTVTTAAGEITQSGRLSVSGTASFSAEDGAANIALTAAGNLFGTLFLTGADVSIQEASATDLGNSTVDSLTVVSGAAITDSGTLTVAGDLRLTSNRSTITLDEVLSSIRGTLHLKGTHISVRNDGDTDLGTITATGTLTVTSTGAVTHRAGNLNVTGLATISAGGDEPNITLTAGTNHFGSVSLFGADVAVTEASATALSLTTVTNLTVVSQGAITDAGVVTVSGNASFTAVGRPITLDEPTSSFQGLLSLQATNIAVINSTATTLGVVTASGKFQLVSAGDVTQPDEVTQVIGRVTITAADETGDFDITLGSDSKFGSISVFGRNVTLNEANATNLFTSVISGDFLLTSAGVVTDSGTLSVAGTTTINAGNHAIKLDSSGSEFSGALSLSGSHVTVVNTTDTELGTTTAAGNLRVTSSGAITQTGPLRVTGRATFTATGRNILLEHAENEFGSISLFGEDIRVREQDATNLFTSTATGTFTLQSGGEITDSGPLTVPNGLVTLRASDIAVHDILLDSAATMLGGSVILIGRNVTLRCQASLDLGFVDAAGSLTIISRGDISDSNPTNVVPPAPVLSAAGAVFIHAGGELTLDEIRSFPSANVILVGDAGTHV